MASVYRRPKSRFWWAKIRTASGPRQFSTEQTERNAALAVALAAEREVVGHRSTLHATLQKLADEFAPVHIPKPDKFLLAWVKRHKPEIAEGTYKRYKIAVNRAIPHLNPQLAILDKASILHIRDKMAEEFAPATVNLTLKILRMALQEAVNDGLLASNPAKSVKNLRGGAKVKRPFTMEELVRLLAVCNPEWKALTILGLITGQRLNDLTILKWHQVQRVQLKDPKREVGILILTTIKTKKHLELPLPPFALAALAGLPDPLSHDLPVFPTIVGLKAPSRSNHFRTLLHQAKLTLAHPRDATSARGPGRTVQPLSFHSLRHTATTLLKASGASLSIAQAVVGHDSETMSQHYTHLDPEQLRPAVDAMTSRLEIALRE